MSENILNNIITKKIERIDFLKKTTNLVSLDKIIEIFKGKDNDFSKAVCLNAAAGLIVCEKFSEFSDAYKFAREFILTGKPYSHLEKMQNV